MEVFLYPKPSKKQCEHYKLKIGFVMFICQHVSPTITQNPHISAPKQKLKNLVGNFFARVQATFLQKNKPSSFKSEGTFKVIDRQTDTLTNMAKNLTCLLKKPYLSQKLIKHSETWS